MPTADSVGAGAHPVAEWRRAVRDVGHLVRFRAGTVRRPRALRAALAALVLVTAGVASLPALAGDAVDQSGRVLDALLLLPTALAGFVLVSVASAVAAGGGRELVDHDPAGVWPISPTTDHLGALLLAPLNIAWLLQAWLLLGVTAYAVPPAHLPGAQLGIVLWLALGTAVGQLAAWTAEAVRRGPHGVALVRGTLLLAALAAGALQVSGRLGGLLDGLQTRWLLVGLVSGPDGAWAGRIAVEITALVVVVVLGAWPAHRAARRLPRDELRAESETQPARRLPRTALGVLVRTDRASVWRAVPMRRGMVVLAVGPGLIALAGQLTWPQVVVLPALVVSGGALLFGVNVWCLDARGGLWRESLPVGPGLVFAARAYVLAEFLATASAITLALASMRAGVPTAAEVTAVLCGWVVVLGQVVAGAMRWSARRPFAVDLRSARATPAPPLVMVGYSARLAITTTLTALVFSGLAQWGDPVLTVLVAALLALWSGVRLVAARDAWTDPVVRARVVTTVAG